MTRLDDTLLPEFVREALDSEASPSKLEQQELAEVLGSKLSMALTPVPPVPAARDRLLASALAGAERYAPFFDRLSRLFDLGVDRIREIMSGVNDPARWESGPLPGVLLMHFSGGAAVTGADVGLVRMPAGLKFPVHRHIGGERVFILEGSYTDSEGKLWLPGDLHEMGAETSHAYQVLSDGLLFALVLYGGVEIQGV